MPQSEFVSIRSEKHPKRTAMPLLDTIRQFIVQVVQLKDFCYEKGICCFLRALFH